MVATALGRCGSGELLVLLLLLLVSPCASAITDNGQVTSVVGVAGRRADLPCDVTAEDPEDHAVLVLWYRDKEGTPIYSFDARGDRSFAGRSRVDGDASRATFVASAQPASLRLAAVRPEDQAVYRCRVDFLLSPTRNRRVRLHVVVPPGLPVFIYRGEAVSGTLGPVAEGEPLEISCVSHGGQPPPRVTWYRDELLLDDTDDSAGPGSVTNVLRLPPLAREDFQRRLECSATNNNISAPAVSRITVDMFFRPLGVEILGSARASMLAGKSYDLVCRAYGSRPPANISWWIGNRKLSGYMNSESDQGNITTSTLPFTPSSDDHADNITCRAENRHIAGSSAFSSRLLNVRFAPLVSLQLGPALDPGHIREGGDVYFECNIRANPGVYIVNWFHDDAPLTPTARSSGVGDMVTINDRSLVIRNITKRSAGAYRCRASNPEGEGASQMVYLSVQYAPVCVDGQKLRYGTARNEAAQVTCQVDANPDHVTFRWQFNSSTESLDLPFSQITTSGLRSSASYTPKTELDFGVLVCFAENKQGKIAQPCIFRIVPAGPPERLQNCALINQTSESLQATCKAGFDGGLSQYFVAELFDLTNDRLVRNLTRPFPEFSVTQLPAGLELRLKLYAANSRGRSRAELLDGFTLKAAEKRVSSSAGQNKETSPQQGFAVTPVLGVLIGVVASLIIIAIGVVVCIRNSSRHPNKPRMQTDLINSSLLIKTRPTSAGGHSAGESAAGKSHEVDHNPDVIPNSHDPGYAVEPATHLMNHLNVSILRRSSPSPSLPPGSPSKAENTQKSSVTFAELTLPRSGRAGKAELRPPDSVPTFATFNPRHPEGRVAVRTVVMADQESVV